MAKNLPADDIANPGENPALCVCGISALIGDRMPIDSLCGARTLLGVCPSPPAPAVRAPPPSAPALALPRPSVALCRLMHETVVASRSRTTILERRFRGIWGNLT